MAQRIPEDRDILSGDTLLGEDTFINKTMSTPSTDPLSFEGLTKNEANSLLNPASPTPFLSGAMQSGQSAGSPKTPKTTDPIDFNKMLSAAAPAAAGMRSLTPINPTTSVGQATAGVGKNVLGGAIGGALSGAAIGAAGGPVGATGGAIIGGGLSLLFSGVDAFFNVKNSREKKRAAKRANKIALEAQERSNAEARKWMQINRMDSIEQARYDRNRQKAQDKWTNYQKSKGIMRDILNSNQTLASNFRQMARTA